MRYIKIIGILFLVFQAPLLLAQKYAITDIPLELLKNAKEITREDNTEIHVKNANEYRYSKTIAHTILNKKSTRNQEVVSYDSNSKIISFKAYIYDKTGKLVLKSKKKNIRDYSNYDGFSVFSDNRVRVLTLAHTEYPYTIEFKYEVIRKEVLNYPNWYISPGFNTLIQHSSYQITLENGTGIYFKNSLTEIEPAISNKGNAKVYHWEIANVPAIKYEPYAPRDIFPHVKISPKQFEMDAIQGSMKNWEALGNFVYKLNEGRSELSPAMKRKVQEIITEAADEQTKINRLYRYVQENMRYVSVQLGVGGYQTFSANYVEKNKYGDCKALTFFMRALLAEAGIEANPALIYSGRDGAPNLEEDFTESMFNHIILNVPSSQCWLECTSNTMPPGYFTSSNTNRKALLIKATGSQLIEMPKIENNLKQNKVVISLSENGSALIDNSISAYGMSHEYYRSIKNNLSEEEIKKRIQESLSIASFSFEAFDISAEEEKPEASLSYKLAVSKYASKGGKRLFVPLNPINTFSLRPKAIKNRKLPVYGNDTYELKSEIELQIPAGYQIESIPQKPVELDSPFGKYSLSVQEKEGKVLVKRSFEEKPFREPAEQYAAYRSFYNKIAKADKAKAVLVKIK